MYVSRKHKAFFIAVPKTGSSSVSRVLIRDYGFVRRKRHHGVRFQMLRRLHRRRGFMVIAGVRSPYSRAVSLWDDVRTRKWRDPALMRLRRQFRDRPFEEFAELLATRPQINKLLPQAEFLEGVPVTRLIRYESLCDDLCALPFVETPLHLPRAKPGRYRRDWREYYTTDATWEAVERWASADFQNFGYARNRGAA